MGCVDDIDAALFAYKYISKITDTFPPIQLQSLTVAVNLGCVVNLNRLRDACGENVMYEPELFPSLRLCKYKPMCVNVFNSGKIIICGLKHEECISDLVFDIQSLIKSSI